MSLCCNGRGRPEDFKARGCTDVCCLLVFIVFWGILIFIAAFAFVIGDPIRLTSGQDSFGNVCGKRNEVLGNMSFSGRDMTDRPYLFFLTMSDLHNSMKICVKKCPEKMLNTDEDIANFESETGSSLCRYDISLLKARSPFYPVLENHTLEKMFAAMEEKTGIRPCAEPPVYPTKPILKRCIPDPAVSLGRDILYYILNHFDIFHKAVSDISLVQWEILGLVGLSLVLSFIVAFTIHYLASFVSWIIMIITSIAAVAGTGMLWWAYVDLHYKLDSSPFYRMLEEKNESTFLVFSVVATVFTVILLLIVLVLRKRVHILVKLFREAGSCVRSMPLLMLQPLWTFICLALFFVFWVAALLALATAYYPTKNEVVGLSVLVSEPSSDQLPAEQQNIINKVVTFVNFNESSWVQYTWWYHVVALVWISEFILGCQQMVIAGAVAAWYFTRDRNSVRCPIGHSIYRLIMYHVGSVALGAFLITIFKIPRMILTYISSKMKKHQEFKIVACCLKCCTCCLWCMEKCIKYLNHNAYTVIAIQGVGFCTAAREAFDILVFNALQVATINSVGDFVLFLGKCAVAAITTFVGVIIMKNNPELHFYAIPVFLLSVFSFLIAHCVLSVYEMVIDTLFLCCCEDILKNDGSPERPYYGGSMVLYLKGKNTGTALQPLNTTNDEKPVGDSY